MKEWNDTFPKEYFIKIEGEKYFVGRIILYLINQKYNAEIDIINDESRKIFQHVGILYGQPTEEEAVENAVQNLSDFLSRKKRT